METFETFLERMSNVEKDREMHVGPRRSGNTRAVFTFEGQVCCLESIGFRVLDEHPMPEIGKAILMALGPAPRDFWWTCWDVGGRALAERVAERYGGTAEATSYGPADRWHFLFDRFEDLIRLVHDRHTGELYRRFPEVRRRPEAGGG
jgi:hypothetical protein